ncbi:MAG: DUF3524 domain-containing protein [Spirochaetales bacterium]|nr:DUF3524 domain-containing protein [Spirochaetales bacterium]
MSEILFLEPFYGGSHKYFADGFIKHSRHRIHLLSRPGRFWKWRMESAALDFSRQIKAEAIQKPDALMATNLMDLTQFKGLTGWQDIPYCLYVHENQLDYPLSPGEKRDFHYVWKDYMNFLTADRLIFNSAYNRESFLKQFASFTSRLPDSKPDDPSDLLRAKSLVIPPGCRLIENSPSELASGRQTPPVLLWNQRWEHDKNPESFFAFLKALKKEKIPFRLNLLGERYRNSPDCFTEAQTVFKEQIIHTGYAESRTAYEELLRASDYVISTSLQENFGISVVEAVSAGCIPLLPDRLAYPEVLPREFHSPCLYRGTGQSGTTAASTPAGELPPDMVQKFKSLLDLPVAEKNDLRMRLRKSMEPYSWPRIAGQLDQALIK